MAKGAVNKKKNLFFMCYYATTLLCIQSVELFFYTDSKHGLWGRKIVESMVFETVVVEESKLYYVF